MSSFDFDAEIVAHLAVVRSLQKPSGVFTASAHNVATGYDKAWLRDIYFMTLGFLETGELETVQKAAKALLTVFVKHKDKINWAIANKPHATWQYIHARFHPETFEEYWEEWGNSQNDAVGEVLNILGE
jgi:GH15 family glucan-1,4-alpha-glucosidase